jgi:glutamate dehydrogenase (NAD(P)+)
MGTETTYNIFESAQKQFDRIADMVSLDPAMRDFLRQPRREFSFTLPVHLDGGETMIFRGFKVQYNDALGPTKGGIRFHPQETMDTIRALSMWMTWKCAVTRLPLGGGSSGVAVDTHNLTPREQERLCRAFVRMTAFNSGPEWDVLGPDIMTGPQHMLWMLDEFEAIHGVKSPGYITGKPVGLSGSKGRKEAPGFGVMINVREALKEMGLDVTKTTASVQGFGTVGRHAVQLYTQMGGKVTCIACLNHIDHTSYAFRKKEGFDFEKIAAITDVFGEIDKDKAIAMGCECLPGEAWLEQDVDILVPAAMENQIRLDNVEKIHHKVKILAEAANGPTDLEVDSYLNGREIRIIPDILANAGGVVCSYFEQVQSNMNYYWSKDEVLGKLDSHLTSAFVDVSTFACKNNIPMRDAAYMVAIDRVARACQDRGWV